MIDYQKVDASCWYKQYQLYHLSHSQLYSLIPIQSLDLSHSSVIQLECYIVPLGAFTLCLLILRGMQGLIVGCSVL